MKAATRESVLSELQALAAGGRSLQRRQLRQRHPRLWMAIGKNFADYEQALSAAGISLRRLNKQVLQSWSRERIVQRLKQRAARGHDLCHSALQKSDSALGNAIRHHFHRFDEALKAAGIDPATARKRPVAIHWSKELIVRRLRELHACGQKLHCGALQRAEPLLVNAIQRHFSRHDDALTAAGFDPRLIRKAAPKWSTEKVVARLRQLRDEGADLRARSIRSLDRSLTHGIETLFHAHDAALRAAGIDPAAYEKWTADKVVQELRRRDRLGEKLSLRQLKDAPALFSAMCRHFGSYRQSLEAAGIDPDTIKRMEAIKPSVAAPKRVYTTDLTPEVVLSELNALAAQGRSLRPETLQFRNRRLWAGIIVHFSNHASAVAAAGIDSQRVTQSRYERWDREVIVVRLREFHARGLDLSSTGLALTEPHLVRAAFRLFGSHDAALEAADIDPKPFRKPTGAAPIWTRERVIEQLKQMHARGEPLNMAAIDKSHPRLYSAISRLFPHQQHVALQAAGIDPKSVRWRPKWSKEKVIEELRRRHREGEVMTTTRLTADAHPLYGAILRLFGRYHKALEAAGLDSSHVGRDPGGDELMRWNKPLVLKTLKEMHASGSDLRFRTLKEKHQSLYLAVTSQFGSYANGLREADIEYWEMARAQLAPSSIVPAELSSDGSEASGSRRKWTRERIVEELQRLHAYAEPVHLSALQGLRPTLYDAIRRYFSHQNEALAAAGLDVESVGWRPKWSKEKVIEELRRRHRDGEVLKSTHLGSDSRPLYQAIVRIFGGLRKALDAAGLDSNHVGLGPGGNKLSHWTEAVVLTTIKEMHQNGDDLRHRTMKEKHQPLFFAAKELFGSYANAVKEAGINYWEMSQAQLAKSRSASRES